ncbi:diguanylate cyclase [Paucibacter sp. APW11]|uniref:diguanylate cyclase n=1 Tax=Roseateles aquae TaxID=3077235 RepID=A0ABU3P7P1_9BURK|nr:diguanylate cyclase [Paucibacter sp. APW11]MDT8998596.1 diguanylate cyclase [Paucibacter sp. APW11]
MRSTVVGFLFLVCQFLLLSLGAASAATSPASEISPSFEVQFRSIAVPQSTVPTLAQDRAGFIWVATARGLTRYDGYRLRAIEAEGETSAQRNLGWVRALAPSRDGRMWIGTEFRGLMAYDPEQDRVEPHGVGRGASSASSASVAAAEAPIRSPIRALGEDAQGAVWIGTLGQGLFRYVPAERRYEAQALRWQGEAENRVLALLVGRDGTVWVAHWRGLSRLRAGAGAQWESLFLPGLPAGAPVLALGEASDAGIWLGTQDGRLGLVRDDQVRWVQQGLGGPVQALAEASDGRLWVGTKAGLLWVNRASGAIEARLRHDPRRLSGLAGNDISGLLRDQVGTMWVTGYGLGLQRHQHHPALAVRGPDAAPGSPLAEVDVRALLALRNGEVLAPTQAGPVVRLDGREGGHLATLGVLARERKAVVDQLNEAADGSLWLASAGRLEHRHASGRLLRDWPLDGGRAQQILLRSNGEVWLGMQEGLYRLRSAEADALQRVHPSEGQALHGGVYALLETPQDGSIWVGGQMGLFRERQGQLLPVPQAPGEGLASPVVMGLLQGRDGTMWLDTPVGGLHRLSGWDAQGRARFERIGEQHGMEGVFGANLHEDAQGRIWSQLYVYDPHSNQVQAFGAAEGASFGSFWFFASAELPGGGLLFGGSRGLLRVEPAAFKPTAAALPLVISALRVNGQPYHPASLKEGLELPAGTRTLGVEFAGLDYADPGRLRYQYRLLGLDSDWTSADTSTRNPSFGPLSPGSYTLQMRATLPLAIGDAAQLDLPIVLLPAWWQTVWARLAGLAVLLFSIWAWVRWRTRRLRRRELELQALVDERTAELREASLTDALTGLRNRRYLELRLDDDLRLCLRRFESSEPGLPGPDADLLLMLLDLDYFKRINDAYGHAAGDAVLVQMAKRLRQVFRDTDSLVRWGGEEVLVLVRETQRDDAAELAARVCAAVREQPFEIAPGQSVRVTVSIGFAAYPLDPSQPRAWDWQSSLGLADSALYAAKAQGRDGYVGALRADGLRPGEGPSELAEWQRAERLQVRFSQPAPPKG